MFRAFSLSFAGHAALMLAFLLLSATRQPLRIAEVVRPVRLITHLELPAPAPRTRPAAPRAEEPARAPATPERPAVRPAPVVPAPVVPAPVVPAPVPVAVPRIAIPTRAAPPAPQPAPAETRPGLRERLARRLATTTPAETPSPAAIPPEVANLPRTETAETPKIAALPPGQVPALPGGPVVPLGSFPYAWYLAVLKEQVYSRWSPPSGFFLGPRAAVALISFRIDRAGRLSRVVVKESSGFARFDQSALAAARSLAQVPALPAQYPEETLDVVIRFQNEQ